MTVYLHLGGGGVPVLNLNDWTSCCQTQIQRCGLFTTVYGSISRVGRTTVAPKSGCHCATENLLFEDLLQSSKGTEVYICTYQSVSHNQHKVSEVVGVHLIRIYCLASIDHNQHCVGCDWLVSMNIYFCTCTPTGMFDIKIHNECFFVKFVKAFWQ
jgi:hypothetical protein